MASLLASYRSRKKNAKFSGMSFIIVDVGLQVQTVFAMLRPQKKRPVTVRASFIFLYW